MYVYGRGRGNKNEMVSLQQRSDFSVFIWHVILLRKGIRHKGKDIKQEESMWLCRVMSPVLGNILSVGQVNLTVD